MFRFTITCHFYLQYKQRIQYSSVLYESIEGIKYTVYCKTMQGKGGTYVGLPSFSFPVLRPRFDQPDRALYSGVTERLAVPTEHATKAQKYICLERCGGMCDKLCHKLIYSMLEECSCAAGNHISNLCCCMCRSVPNGQALLRLRLSNSHDLSVWKRLKYVEIHWTYVEICWHLLKYVEIGNWCNMLR